MNNQIEKCHGCGYFDTFNCCCSKEPIMTCVAEIEEHDKEVRARVIKEIDKFMKSFPSINCHVTVMEEWEKIKSQLNATK